MIITNEQADYLIHLKKKIIQDDKILDAINLNQEYPIVWSFDLVSSEDEDFSFKWVIKQSGKNALKISLHYQAADSNIGLLWNTSKPTSRQRRFTCKVSTICWEILHS